MIQSIFASLFVHGRMAIAGSANQQTNTGSQVGLQSKSSSTDGDEAVKVALTGSSRAKAAGAEAASANSAQAVRRGGLLGELLTSLSSVTGQIAKLQDQAAASGLSKDQAEAYANEIKGLTSEYGRIVQSDSFKKITDIAQQAQENLKNGNGSGFYSALSSERGLLGDNFLSIIQNGDWLKATTLSQSFSKIGSVDTSSLGSDKYLVNDILKTIHTATDTLNSVAASSTSTTTLEIPTIQNPGHAIQASQLTFAGADDIAISLRTYSPQDMIQLAAAHVDINPISVLMLVSNPLKDDKTGALPNDPPTNF